MEAALPEVKYVFAEEEDSWKYKNTRDMDAEEQKTSASIWAAAAAEDAEDAVQLDLGRSPEEPAPASIHARMQTCLWQWKVTARELHNATLAAGLSVPARPSWLT